MSTRAVTLEGTMQITALTPESVVYDSVVYLLINTQGLEITSLTIDQSWTSTLSTVRITVNALASQSRADVQNVVTQAFRNIANANPDMIWNVGGFVVTNWPSAQAQDGGGYAGTIGGGLGGTVGGGMIDIGNFDGGTVYGGSTPGTTATGGTTTPRPGGGTPFEQQLNDISTWLKAHQTEAMLAAVLLVVLITKR